MTNPKDREVFQQRLATGTDRRLVGSGLKVTERKLVLAGGLAALCVSYSLLQKAVFRMHFLRVIVLAGLCFLAVVPLRAQSPQLKRIVDGHWLQLSVVEGRISVEGMRFGRVQMSPKTKDRKETLAVRNDDGRPTLNYDCTTQDKRIVLEIASPQRRIVFRQIPGENSSVVAVEFRQEAKEPLSLSIGSEAQKKVFQSQNLWQLLIAHPDECREYLMPLLELLHPKWELLQTAAAVEERLVNESGSSAADRARWNSLVEQLGDERFAQREAADRELRAGSPPMVAYLRQIDMSRLDAEQQFRLQRILNSFVSQGGDDSIDRIVASLTGDPQVWLALLARPNLATRQAAANQLTMLLGTAIPVDPTAEPESQREAWEKLRTQIDTQ